MVPQAGITIRLQQYEFTGQFILKAERVPQLYDLLSPLKERPAIFYLGNREFDPVKVGYQTQKIPGVFEFNTKRRGNWNTGHLFDQSLNPNRPSPEILGPR